MRLGVCILRRALLRCAMPNFIALWSHGLDSFQAMTINMTWSQYVAEMSAPANHDDTKTGEGMIGSRSLAE
jgi:hypothetical protein